MNLPDDLDLIAAAPEGIRKLRGLILELAVRGKLVPQDPNDEPASELLKRVDAERRQLKLPPRLPVDDAPAPFFLPEGWQWLRFGDVAQHNSGKTLDKGRNSGHARRYITTSNLYWGHFELTSVREMLIRDEELERCTARRNDLLICEGGEAGRAAVWDADEEICFQNHVHRARFFAGINPYYAYRILQRLDLSGEINLFRKGVGISNLSGKALASIPFPLPPLAEQHRIVAKVDELMALCDRLEAEQSDAAAAHERLVATLLGTLTQSTDAGDLAANWQRVAEHFDALFTTEASLDALKQTILQLAIMGKLVPQDPSDEPASELLKRIAKERAQLEAEGKVRKSKLLPALAEDELLFELPKGWKWSRFSTYAIEVSTGPFGSMLHQSDYRPGGIPLVNPSHMIGGKVVPEAHIAVDAAKANELSNYRLACGDIVMARRGEVGRTALITENENGWLCGTGSFVIRLAKDVSRPFIVTLFRASSIRHYLGAEAVGTTMVNLNHGILNSMPVAIPPLAEQHRIVAKVDELLALVDRLKAGLAESRTRQAQLADTLIETALAVA